MNITVKPFSKGSSPTRLAIKKGEGYLDLKKVANFKEVAKVEYSGSYGKSSFEEEYTILAERILPLLFVQKWTGIGATRPWQVWEPVLSEEQRHPSFVTE